MKIQGFSQDAPALLEVLLREIEEAEVRKGMWMTCHRKEIDTMLAGRLGLVTG